jgi:hypothetical protein
VYKRNSDKLKEKFAQEYEYSTVYGVIVDKLREKFAQEYIYSTVYKRNSEKLKENLHKSMSILLCMR